MSLPQEWGSLSLEVFGAALAISTAWGRDQWHVLMHSEHVLAPGAEGEGQEAGQEEEGQAQEQAQAQWL